MTIMLDGLVMLVFMLMSVTALSVFYGLLISIFIETSKYVQSRYFRGVGRRRDTPQKP